MVNPFRKWLINPIKKVDQILIDFFDRKIWARYFSDTEHYGVLGPLAGILMFLTLVLLSVYVYYGQMVGWMSTGLYAIFPFMRLMSLYGDKKKQYTDRNEDRQFPARYSQCALSTGVSTALALPIIFWRLPGISPTEYWTCISFYNLIILVEIIYAYMRRVYYFEEWRVEEKTS